MPQGKFYKFEFLHKKISFLKPKNIILYMEDLVMDIAYDPETNRKKMTILNKADQKSFCIYSIDIEKLKELIDEDFNYDFESIKKAYLVDILTQKINISLDEFYKIIKTDLTIAAINKFIFDKVKSIYIPDSGGIYLLYKEIFNGNLDLETFRKVFLEMLIQWSYKYIISNALYVFEEIKSLINNI